MNIRDFAFEVENAASDFETRGWEKVVVPFGTKEAKGKGWPASNPSPEVFKKGPHNIGVKLGPKSGGLVDIDLDCQEAIELVDEFFPTLKMAAFGRLSPDGSHTLGHRLVTCPDIPSAEAAVHDFGFTTAEEQATIKALGFTKMKLLEVRAGKGYTGFPPSWYPAVGKPKGSVATDDKLTWRHRGATALVPEIPVMPFADVKRMAGLLAFASLVLAVYPREQGTRDDFCLQLSGALIHANIEPEKAAKLINILARHADDDSGERGEKAQRTADKKAEGEPVTNLSTFLEYCGLAACEKKVRVWLGMTAKTKEAKAGKAAAEEPDKECSIIIGVDQLKDQAKLIADKFREAKIPLFRRDTEVVRIHRFPETIKEGEITFAANSTVLRPNDWRWIRTEVDSLIKYYVETNSGYRRVHATIDSVRTLEDRIADLGFPELRGLSHVPTLDRDEPGYDPVSKLYHAYNKGDFPKVPEKPTKDDAIAAGGRVMHHARLVCFATELDKAVYFSYLLTSVIRPMLRSAPAFGFSAPFPRSGKSMLVQCGGILATGAEVPVTPYYGKKEKDDASWETLLSTGSPLVCLDNASSGVYNDLICMSLTAPEVEVRRYGFNDKKLRLPTRITVTITGNNLRILRDMIERTLRCELMPMTAQPGELKFDFKPEDEVMAARASLVVDVLTILKAYQAAGDKPVLRSGFGGFEEWSNLVRGAVIWLGLDDPMGTLKKLRAEDDARGDLKEALAVLYGRFGVADFSMNMIGLDETCTKVLGAKLKGGRWDNRIAGYMMSDMMHRPEGGLTLKPVKGALPKRWKVEGAPDAAMTELIQELCAGTWNEEKFKEWEKRVENQVPS